MLDTLPALVRLLATIPTLVFNQSEPRVVKQSEKRALPQQGHQVDPDLLLLTEFC